MSHPGWQTVPKLFSKSEKPKLYAHDAIEAATDLVLDPAHSDPAHSKRVRDHWKEDYLTLPHSPQWHGRQEHRTGSKVTSTVSGRDWSGAGFREFSRDAGTASFEVIRKGF